MELFSGVQGSYLIFDIIFMIVAVVIIAGVIFAHLTQKIMLNYWISILLLIRICFGLIQPYFPGITFFIGPEYALIWGFVSYTAMDCLLFLIINVSHNYFVFHDDDYCYCFSLLLFLLLLTIIIVFFQYSNCHCFSLLVFSWLLILFFMIIIIIVSHYH